MARVMSGVTSDDDATRTHPAAPSRRRTAEEIADVSFDAEFSRTPATCQMAELTKVALDHDAVKGGGGNVKEIRQWQGFTIQAKFQAAGLIRSATGR